MTTLSNKYGAVHTHSHLIQPFHTHLTPFYLSVYISILILPGHFLVKQEVNYECMY